jgi:hypothetical protein
MICTSWQSDSRVINQSQLSKQLVEGYINPRNKEGGFLRERENRKGGKEKRRGVSIEQTHILTRTH